MEQITLDLIPNGSMPVLHASQYDDGRQWKVNLKENGEDYTLSDETIVLDVRKGDGCAVTCAVAVESGKKYVILTSTEQMCAVAGQNLAELQITKGNMKIGTLNFILQVERDPLNGSISSSSEIHDLQHQVDECVDNALADLGASGLPYDNTESGLEATNVQQAIDEVNAKASGLPSDVYTKEETDALLAEKADKADVYDKDYMNGIFEQIDNAFTGVNNALATKANSADVYNKTYIDTALSAKANANTVYTKAETDAKVAGLIDDTARADDKTWSSNKIFQMFTVEDEASGAIARFNTDLTENLLSAVAEFSASQASGTPTPSAPIPIVGVNKVNVTRTGKNLFDPLKAVADSTGVTYTDGWINFKTNGVNRIYYKNLNFGQVRISGVFKTAVSTNNVLQIIGYYSDGTNSYIVNTASTDTNEHSFVGSSSANKTLVEIRTGYTSSLDTSIKIQMEVGSTATDFEPYNGTTALINLGGTYYGGSVDAVTGKITLTHKIETIPTKTALTPLGSHYYVGTTYADMKNVGITRTDDIKSEVVPFNSVLGDYFCYYHIQDMCVIGVPDNYTIEEYNQNIAGTKIVYPLETPIVVYASNTAEIPTLNGFNQVFADTGDVAVKYLESIKSYIDNKLA